MTNIMVSPRILSITDLTGEEAAEWAMLITDSAKDVGYEAVMEDFVDTIKLAKEIFK